AARPREGVTRVSSPAADRSARWRMLCCDTNSIRLLPLTFPLRGRNPMRSGFLFALLFAVASRAATTPHAQITTYHNDNARTSLNAKEKQLTPARVSVDTFGKLFSFPVDGFVYAQPLYLPAVAIPGKGTHSVLFVV